jgi:hypothetical protein
MSEHSQGQEGHGGGGCCRGGGHEGAREGEGHAEQTARQWERAFWHALGELQVDAVKEKLKAAWGPKIDQTASAVVEAMIADWKAFHDSESARSAFRERLKKSFES